MTRKAPSSVDQTSKNQSGAHLWMIVIGLALGTAATNGLSRFGYGLILPAMKADLEWSYTLAGWLNTANALGYLIGALLAFRLTRMWPLQKLFIFGLALTAVAVVGTGLTDSFTGLSLLRILTGIGNALVFICGGPIAASLAADRPGTNALVVGVYFSGVGLGVLSGGLFIAPLIEHFGESSWPLAWLLMGAVCSVMSVPAIFAVRRVANTTAQKASAQLQSALPVQKMMPYIIGYFLYGFGAVIFITFVATWLRDDGASLLQVIVIWSLMGGGMMASPFLWHRILARFDNGIPLALSCCLTAITMGIPLLKAGDVSLWLSAFVFGVVFMAGPSAVTVFTKKNLPQASWGPAVALFTVGFAAGQPLGPVAAGWIADVTEDLSLGLGLGAGALLLGCLIAGYQKPLPKHLISQTYGAKE